MKLASLKAGGRDGTLVVVNRVLTQAVKVSEIATTMQHALENWHAVEGKLKKIYEELNTGKAQGVFAFNTHEVSSPLPRAYQWVDGSAYVNHVELVRKSRGVEMPESFWTDPLMYQGGSDSFIGPCDDISLGDEKWGIDFEGEVAAITDDVPMGITPADARSRIKLIMLVNDVSLRYLAMPELQKQFGFLQSKPATAFSPVAVTPDELGDAWDGGKACLPLVTHYNGELFGKPDAGVDMVFDFPALVAHAAKTRYLCAGTIVGSGTVSNKDRSVGSSCIVEKRLLEKMEFGDSKTPFMHFGNTVKIEMFDKSGKSIFGAIDQKVVQYIYKSKAA